MEVVEVGDIMEGMEMAVDGVMEEVAGILDLDL